MSTIGYVGQWSCLNKIVLDFVFSVMVQELIFKYLKLIYVKFNNDNDFYIYCDQLVYAYVLVGYT